jgi:ribosomal protein S19
MTNFAWKPNYIDPNLLSIEFKRARKKIVWSRDSTVPESLIGQAVFIHNGKDFIKSYITR